VNGDSDYIGGDDSDANDDNTQKKSGSQPTRKGTIKLNDVKTEIDFVQSQPCLWDQGDSDFMKSDTKDGLWSDIAKLIRCTVPEVKNWWKLQRENFNIYA
jgi:hypothetical protein